MKKLFVLLFASIGLAAQAAQVKCSWNDPGANPTISSPELTLKSMGIIDPVLAQKIRSGDYYKTISFHKNDQRMFGMSSGNAKFCNGPVDTSNWKNTHVEQGRVFVNGKNKVVWMWRCKNMGFWLEEEPSNVVAQPIDFEPTGAGYAVPAQPADKETFETLALVSNPELVGVTATTPSQTINFQLSTPVFILITKSPTTTAQVPAIPEPSTYLMFLLGLIAIALRSRSLLLNSVYGFSKIRS